MYMSMGLAWPAYIWCCISVDQWISFELAFVDFWLLIYHYYWSISIRYCFCKSLLILVPDSSFLMVLGFKYVYGTMRIFFSTVLLSVWRHHIAVADRDSSCLQGYHGYLLAVVHLTKTFCVVSVSAFMFFILYVKLIRSLLIQCMPARSSFQLHA